MSWEELAASVAQSAQSAQVHNSEPHGAHPLPPSGNVDYRMKRYIFRRTVEGIHIIQLGKTWEMPDWDGGLGPSRFQPPPTAAVLTFLLREPEILNLNCRRAASWLSIRALGKPHLLPKRLVP